LFYNLSEAQQGEFAQALDTLQRVYERAYTADMLITFDRNMGFGEDAAFMEAFSSSVTSQQEASLLWRLHVLCWCAGNALGLEGDFVECGVFRGFSTAVAAKYLKFERQKKKWYLYDTFSGIPDDQLNAGQASPSGYGEPSLYEQARHRFASWPNIHVLRGRIPEILGAEPKRIAFLHLDLNSAKAELGALEVLYDRIVPGGYLLLDDYGWYEYREQKAREDPFLAARGCKVLELPTGQGLAIKPARG
jgi:O-methyltransferase